MDGDALSSPCIRSDRPYSSPDLAPVHLIQCKRVLFDWKKIGGWFSLKQRFLASLPTAACFPT